MILSPPFSHRLKNLVVVNSVGRDSTAQHAAYAIRAHFSNVSEWQCIVMVWNASHAVEHAFTASGCELVVWQRARWGQFLHMLTPALVDRFDHIAVLLDDIFVPRTGPFAVSVPRLLRTLREHRLGGISPAVFGAHVKPMFKLTRNCLRRVRAIETFFAIYTREAWQCMARLFVASNVGGCGYDFCYATACPQFKLAVDDRSAIHHLEKARPDRWVVRKMSSEDTTSLLPASKVSSRVWHTDNPCKDADFAAVEIKHRCNYSRAFISYEPTDSALILRCDPS
jgi:hypothetical protein